MITIKIQGGLGNQMFQFATGYAKSLQYSDDLYLDTSYFKSEQKRVFLLDEFVLDDRVFVNGTSTKKSFLSLLKRRPIVDLYQESSFNFDDSFDDIEGAVRLEGYFQTEKYFENYRKDVCRALSLSKAISNDAVMMTREISAAKVAVSLHVRRGDYLNTENSKVHYSLPVDYYLSALSIFKSLYGDNLSVFYFSDDPEYLRKNFTIRQNDKVIDGNTERPAEDMFLMSQCDHHIIANSSFSWWGAWLNRSKKKRVIAPRQWFQPEVMRQMNTCDLYPNGWITL